MSKYKNQLYFSDKPRQSIQKQRHHFADKGPSGGSGHVLLGAGSRAAGWLPEAPAAAPPQ